MDYLVTWEIDIEGVDSALAAALEARRIMLDQDSIATDRDASRDRSSGSLRQP